MAVVTLLTPAPTAAPGIGPKGSKNTPVDLANPKWPRPHSQAQGQLAVTSVTRTLTNPAADTLATVQRRAPYLLASAAIYALYFE